MVDSLYNLGNHTNPNELIQLALFLTMVPMIIFNLTGFVIARLIKFMLGKVG